MSPIVLGFGVIQAISLVVAIALTYEFLRHAKDREHIFSLLGHGKFTEHKISGLVLLCAYIVCVLGALVIPFLFL